MTDDEIAAVLEELDDLYRERARIACAPLNPVGDWEPSRLELRAANASHITRLERLLAGRDAA